MTQDEILTIRDVAELLKVGEKTVYTMAQRGELPAFKVRGQWRFRRGDIGAWIDAQTAHPRSNESANSKKDGGHGGNSAPESNASQATRWAGPSSITR